MQRRALFLSMPELAALVTRRNRQAGLDVRLRLKRLLGYLIANPQSIRWATQGLVFDRFLCDTRGDVALDVGCAGGTYAVRYLRPRFRTVVGVELEQPLAALAARQIDEAGASGDVVVSRGDFRALPLPDGSAGLVFSSEVLEHIAEADVAIAEAHRVLRPGGQLLISVPVPPEPYHNPEHEHPGFSSADMTRRLERCGFEILRQQYCMFALTRFVALLVHRLRVPLPLNPLCWFEQLTARWIPWPKPWNIVILARKAS